MNGRDVHVVGLLLVGRWTEGGELEHDALEFVVDRRDRRAGAASVGYGDGETVCSGERLVVGLTDGGDSGFVGAIDDDSLAFRRHRGAAV